MNAKRVAKPKWTVADRARHKALREEFAHCPTQEDLQASGAYEGPIKRGAYFAVKVVVNELKASRQAAGLTLAALSKLTGMDEASLSRLENGHQPNPTVDTLWRYARALGRQLVLTHAVLTHADAVTTPPGNGRAAKLKPRKRRAANQAIRN